MLLVCNEQQKVIARLKAHPALPSKRPLVATASHMRDIFRVLKTLPPSLICVEVNYPEINNVFYQLNKEVQMDIENIVAQSAHSEKPKTEIAKTLFVAPVSESLPDDGVLQYTTIESLYDLKTVADRAVVTVRDDQLDIIRCVADNTSLFGLALHTLTGLPAANYSVAFEEATWSFDKVAYAPFISELRIAGEIESQLAAQNRTTYDVEKSAYTRKTGLVKEHADFTQVDAGDESDEEMRL